MATITIVPSADAYYAEHIPHAPVTRSGQEPMESAGFSGLDSKPTEVNGKASFDSSGLCIKPLVCVRADMYYPLHTHTLCSIYIWGREMKGLSETNDGRGSERRNDMGELGSVLSLRAKQVFVGSRGLFSPYCASKYEMCSLHPNVQGICDAYNSAQGGGGKQWCTAYEGKRSTPR